LSIDAEGFSLSIVSKTIADGYFPRYIIAEVDSDMKYLDSLYSNGYTLIGKMRYNYIFFHLGN